MSATFKTAVFAGGCFWCMQSEFESQKGVVSVVSGFTGGSAEDADYHKVSSKKTAHVEAVEVTYDPAQVNYATLLNIFWSNIDPTDAGGQFYDRGAHYTTAIYYGSAEEKDLAEASKAKNEAKLGKPIMTKILPATPFYAAAEEHQDFYKKNPTHYNAYKKGSGREEKLKEIWQPK